MKKLLIILISCSFALLTSAQNTIITNKNLTIEVNNELQTKINSTFSNAQSLTNNFSSSEYLETKYFTAKLFHQTKKEKKNIHDAAGDGTEYKFYGMNDSNKIEKILSNRALHCLSHALFQNLYNRAGPPTLRFHIPFSFEEEVKKNVAPHHIAF